MDLSINFKEFFDTNPQGFIIIKDGFIIDVNNTSLKLIKANNKEDLIGKSIIDFIHKDSIENFTNSLKLFEQNNNNNLPSVIININCLDETKRRFEFSFQVLEQNVEQIYLIILREIEEYLKAIDELKEKEEKLNAILKTIHDLMFIINNKKIIVDYYSDKDIVLYTEPNKFLEKSIYQSLPEYLAKIVDKKIDLVLQTGKKEEFEYYLIINDKKYYYYATLVKKSEVEVFAVIRDITSIKELEIALEEELIFNSILNYLSIKFINCKEDEMDLVLNNALADIGKYFGVDRVYIFEFDFPNRKMNNTYEWCANDISPEIENLQGIDIDLYPGFLNFMLNKKPFIIDSIKEYEDEILKKVLEAQGILSLIIYPIFIETECFGCVGFDSVKSLRKFSEKELRFLNLLSNFLSSVFQKIKTEKELKLRKKELESSRLAYLNIIDDLRTENEERKRFEKELKLSEEKFRSYVEQTSGIIFVIQRNALFSYVSPSVKDLIGENPENLIGKRFTSIINSEDIHKISSQLKEVLKTLKPIKSVPIRIKHKNGSYIWMVVQAGPILNEDGSIKEIIGVAVDVNELIQIREQLSKTELRYQSLFENQIEAYALHELILDNEGNPCDYRFIDVNKSFLEMTGLTDKKEIVGKTVLEVWPNIEKDWIQIFGNIALKGGHLTIEKFSPNFNKTFLINVYSQEGLNFAVSFFDITDRKKSEIINNIQLNIAKAIIQLEDIGQLILTIKNELSNLLDTTNFFVAKYDENKKEFITLIFIDEKDEYEDVWSEEQTLSSIVVKNKSPLLLRKKEIEEIDRLWGAEHSENNPEIWLGVPILIKKKCVGIIVLQSYKNPNAYDQSTIDLLQIIASQLTVFIEQREFESQIRLLSKAIEQSSAIVVITDKNNNILFANKKFYQISKYSEDEVIGKNPRILKSNFHKDDFYKQMWRALSEGKEWTGEILNKDKFGNLYWVSATISPIIGSDGKINNYIAIEEDITEKKRMQEKIESSEKQLRTTWEYSIDGMRLTDENGIIVAVNQALCNLYEVERHKLIGKPFYYMIKNYNGGGLKKFRENIKTGNVEALKEYLLELENGKVLNVELTNSIIRLDDGKNYLFSIFRDVTEKKKMINELIAAKEKAEEMNRIKSQFFANMSHELRTPFMGILGYTELLREKVTDDEGILFLDGISKSSNRMIETLTNILDITKFESGKVDTKRELIDPAFTILEICEQFKYQAIKKSLILEKNINLPDDFRLSTNDKLFRSILNNLLSNAIKFTFQGKVSVNAFVKDSQFFIEVEDTGIGIPKEKQQLIFDEFRQVSEGHARAFEGTGLGLSIAKKFVELLGGRIEVESELNKGSKFTVIIPI